MTLYSFSLETYGSQKDHDIEDKVHRQAGLEWLVHLSALDTVNALNLLGRRAITAMHKVYTTWCESRPYQMLRLRQTGPNYPQRRLSIRR